jgi:hypothetical protein
VRAAEVRPFQAGAAEVRVPQVDRVQIEPIILKWRRRREAARG